MKTYLAHKELMAEYASAEDPDQEIWAIHAHYLEPPVEPNEQFTPQSEITFVREDGEEISCRLDGSFREPDIGHVVWVFQGDVTVLVDQEPVH